MYKLFKYIFIIFMTLNLILYSDKMTAAALNGLNTWFTLLIPSLFPFMIISSWLSFGINNKKNILDKITYKLFGLPSYCLSIFIISFLSGYPVGAKIISSMYHNQTISSDTSEHLLSFCNNPGIIFIISAVSSTMLSDRYSSLFFIIVCIISSLFTGIMYNIFFHSNGIDNPHCSTSKSTTIPEAISSAITSILTVGACIIFFSVVKEAVTICISIHNPLYSSILGGALEFSSGIVSLSKLPLPKKTIYPIISAILCFGGFSVHMQTFALIGKSKIDFKKYIISKIFCASFAYLFSTVIFDSYFSVNAAYIPVFKKIYTPSYIFILSSIIAFSSYILLRKKKRHLN